MKTIMAVVKAGHQVASGKSTKDRRFPEGTIKMQLPFFKERGFDFNSFFDGDFVCGTLNLSLLPAMVTILSPEYVFKEIMWTDLQPAENFFLSPASINYRDKKYKAVLYIPDPATKPDHFQAAGTIEVIAQTIPNLVYGEKVELEYNPEAVAIA